MKILKIMAILLAVVAVVSTAGCFEKAQVAGNETQKASGQVTTAAVSTTSVAKSAPSVTPLEKENTDLTSSTVVDVVCKMKIDKRTAEFTSKYRGTMYYFCALSCKKEFDTNPEKYINSEITENELQAASEQVMSSITDSTDSTSSSVVDVICGMTIDKGTAEFTSEYKGTTYYFCALSCKNEFDANPEKYISSETTEDETSEASEQVTSVAANNADSTSSSVVDVICGMTIDKGTAEFTSEYKGTMYYFCALSCKNEFDANPEKYISSETAENNSEIAENETEEASEQETSAAKNCTASALSTVVDVVCKMEIDRRTAEFKSEYKGTTYYFCSAYCKNKFDANPEKYISSETTENNSETTEDETQKNCKTTENETEEASEQETSAAKNCTASALSTVVDVVCKMEIDRRTAEFKSEYKGTTYYFCSASCKKEFDENPEKYINPETAENNSEITENQTQEASEQVTPEATNNTDSALSTVVDVVCKMEIDRRTAEFKSEYKGTTYYFCALSCKNEFDANPEKYIGSETTGNSFNTTGNSSNTTGNSSNTTENDSNTAGNSSNTTENETEEASEQVTPETTNDTDSASSNVVDVVCKMEIDKRTAEFKSEYKGTTYYFCALSCKEEFDANPEKYIGSETTE